MSSSDGGQRSSVGSVGSVGSDGSVLSNPASELTEPDRTRELGRETSSGQSLKSVIFFDYILNFILKENYKPNEDIFRIGFKGKPDEILTEAKIDIMNRSYGLINEDSDDKTEMVIQMKTILEQIKPILIAYCGDEGVASYIVSKNELESKIQSKRARLNYITEAYVDSILVEVGAMGDGTDLESTPLTLTEKQIESDKALLSEIISDSEKLVKEQQRLTDIYKAEFTKKGINITSLKTYIKQIRLNLEENLEKKYVSPDSSNVDEYFFVLFLLFSIANNILEVKMPNGRAESLKSLTILLKGIYNMDSPTAVLVGGSKRKKTKKKKSKTKKKKSKTKKKKARTKKRKSKAKKKKSKTKKKKTKKR